MKIGEVRTVKVLGSLCLIDQDELDWKILAINMDDSLKYGVSNFQSEL